jgi:hypothetical protein
MSPEAAAALIGAIPVQTANQGFTANTVNDAAPPKKKSALPFVLIGGLALVGLLLALVLKFAGGKHDDAEADRAKPADSATSASSPAATTVLTVDPAAASANNATAKPSVQPAPQSANAKPSAPPSAEVASPPATSLALPAAPVVTPPSAPANAHPAATKTERCYADPFTGQIRVAGAGHMDANFACKQNPFTGAYQRL